MASNSTRRASHAGSWYIASGSHLTAELEKWLADAPVSESHSPARAIIAPHAGYRYSGPCAAHAYKQVDPVKIKRVFILGPSHHVYLSGCALSAVQVYETPLYNLDIDQEVYRELHASGKFEIMTRIVDEEEHSIEMHLPYVAKVMESRKGQYKIVPVLVGALKEEGEASYGQLFSKYLARPENLFVVSSDFCHWGKRFRYTLHNKSKASISASIRDLDHRGMGLIESLDPLGFSAYLEETQNTICGRRPISILLNTVNAQPLQAPSASSQAVSHLQSTSAGKFSLKFVKYAQSNQCQSPNDSSVSYASASLVAVTEHGQH